MTRCSAVLEVGGDLSSVFEPDGVLDQYLRGNASPGLEAGDSRLVL
jgi:hypothetical protein